MTQGDDPTREEAAPSTRVSHGICATCKAGVRTSPVIERLRGLVHLHGAATWSSASATGSAAPAWRRLLRPPELLHQGPLDLVEMLASMERACERRSSALEDFHEVGDVLLGQRLQAQHPAEFPVLLVRRHRARVARVATSSFVSWPWPEVCFVGGRRRAVGTPRLLPPQRLPLGRLDGAARESDGPGPAVCAAGPRKFFNVCSNGGLALMRRIHGVKAGSLRQLRPALRTWLRLMEDADWWRWEPKADAPWWYGERGLLSQFAGAIWRSGGRAIEEYATAKRERVGGRRFRQRNRAGARGDLEFWWPTSDISFVGEAKAKELSLSKDCQTWRSRLKEWLDECVRDVRCHPRREKCRRIGILFVAPYFARGRGNRKPLSQDERKRILGLCEVLKEIAPAWGCAAAWTFPGVLARPQGILPSVGTYAYPGALIVVADATGWRLGV